MHKVKQVNPLLEEKSPLDFNKIRPEHFQEAVTQTIDLCHATTKKLLGQKGQKKTTWDNSVAPLDLVHEKLHLVWSTICHLNSVLATKDVRSSYEKCLPLVTKYYAEIAQNPKLYRAYNNIATGKNGAKLNHIQKKILHDALRDLRLAGVTLSPGKKKQFTKIQQQLAHLSNKFAHNVLDASQNYLIKLNKKQTKGLPPYALAMGRDSAQKRKQRGWIFTLDFPAYHALITYADSRGLRKKIYIAYVTRATNINPKFKKWDNTKIIEKILSLRIKLAELLDFKNYATYSLATKMAKTTDQVLNFLYDLAAKSLPTAKQEINELKTIAKHYGIKNIAPWDIAYLEVKLSQKKFHLSQEKLRPYLPLTKVMQGIFKIVNKIYGIKIKEKKGVPTWHPDVRYLEIYDAKNHLQGKLYLDLYWRENKRGGAWMDSYQTRYRLKNGKIQLPVAFLVCNFNSPTQNTPTLLTHPDTLTLLHEFGHCLQHLLTKINYAGASGIRGIPWDGVEFASQFMENWGWQKEGVKLMSAHYKTKKPLPKKLLSKLLAMHTYNAALQMLRQLEFALIDFTIHAKKETNTNRLREIVSQIQNQVRVTPIYKHASTLNTFSHIFAGGYAAGYYSYKWAEVLAADAFSKFEERGIFHRKTGREFSRWILETGGSEDPIVLFKKFRGRLPKIDALLKHYGIEKYGH